jgi:ketosteroid isomerase-like protein
MRITRRHLTVAGLLALGATSVAPTRLSLAESPDEAAVAQAAEALRKAMVDADKIRLEDMVADQLSYGHSGGRIESKAVFIDAIVSRKFIFKSITLTDSTIAIAGNDAIVRHVFAGETVQDGKPASARVGALQVWQKSDGRWKLLARQAYKL